ncbi:MAG: TolC family protein [Acidobacteriota bacterium]
MALPRVVGPCLLFLFGLHAAAAAPEKPLTIEEALREARASNARLPLPALDLDLARQRWDEARAERWLRVALEGDFVYAPASSYDPALTNLGEARSQIVARQPLLDGGARHAAVADAEAGIAAAGARYRIAEKDLDLEVRGRFAEMLEAQAEVEIRRGGIERLTTYRTSLRSRQAAGQAVAADLLKTDVRVAAEQANVLEAERRVGEARIALNDLMGRDPKAPLELASLPPPEEAPAGGSPEAWAGAPEIAEAQAQARSADARLTIARSERRPQLFVQADAGLWGSDTSHWIPADLKTADPSATFGDRIRRDAGYSFSLNLSWPVFDLGAMRARQAQAETSLRQARQRLEVARREARLQWEQAEATLENLSRQIALLTAAVPDAHDSYLEAESRYRGGAAPALEVLDAYSSWVEAQLRLADSVARFHIARAVAIRWGTP